MQMEGRQFIVVSDVKTGEDKKLFRPYGAGEKNTQLEPIGGQQRQRLHQEPKTETVG